MICLTCSIGARQKHALERVTAAIKRGNGLERQISDAAAQGDFSALPPEKTIAEAPDLSAFERQSLLALHRKAAGDLATLQRGLERFADPGSKPFDPFDANDRAEVDALYRKLGANPEALSAVFRRTGLIPQAAVASFRDELSSNDPARVQAAAESLSGMLERNPDALTGIAGSSGLQDAVLAYRDSVDERGLSKEAAGAALIEMRGSIDQDAVEPVHEFSGARRGRGQGPGFGEAAGLGAFIVKLFEKYLGKSADPDIIVAEPSAKPDLPQSQAEPKLESEASPSKVAPGDAQPQLAAQRDADVPLIAIRPEEKQDIASRLRTTFEQAADQAPRAPDPIQIGDMTPEGAARINAELKALGIKFDVTGYRHEADAFAARHAHKGHSSQQREAARDQLPVTAEDWAMIPDILAQPDRIVPEQRGQNLSILYRKKINGYILYVEQVRTRARTLSAKTMWKKVADTPD